MAKVQNPKFGLFLSQEWKKLIDPYTPERSGYLKGKTGATVSIRPFEIEYKAPYANLDYYNSRGATFRHDLAPFATDHWDEAAERAGQKDKLIRAANAYLKKE